jgi:hypothetical protein
MKNLYESILNDIEDTIKQGDDYVNTIETEFNKLKKDLCLVQTFNTNKSGNNPAYRLGWYVYNFYCENLLKFGLNIPAEVLTITILANGIERCDDWVIHIKTFNWRGYTKSSAKPITYKQIILPDSEYKSISEIVKNYFKPIFKKMSSMSELKKFLTE